MRKILLLAFVVTSFLSKAQDIDVLHYRFAIDLNDKNDTVFGRAVIKLSVKTPPDFFMVDLAGVGKNGKGMKVEVVEAFHGDSFPQKETPAVFTNFIHENDKIKIPVTGIKANDVFTVYIKYKGIPADGLIISKNKHGDRTFFADNWPNRAHQWIPCVDRPDDKASFEFIVQAPDHYRVVSNGVKRLEYGTGIKLTSWKEDIPQPTKVMVIGAARFATKTYNNSPKDIPVSAWVYPQDSTKGFYDYALAPDILKFFADYIGPFPYKKLANVQSKTIFGGMENASAIFYAESSVTGDRSSEDLLAHEIAHQWFGDMASEKSFAHLWLSEGFATFLTNYYWEKKYGKKAAEKRWKENRDEVIAFSKHSSSPVVDSTKNLMSLLNANSYQKGAWVLRMLRNEVGDSVFQKIIQTYYNQFKGGNADTKDFEAVAEKVSGKELTWFFDQWLYQPSLPTLEVKTSKNSQDTSIVIVQKQPVLFRLNAIIGISDVYNDFHKITPIVITERETEIKLPRGYTKVYIDPYHELLFEGKDEFTITKKSR